MKAADLERLVTALQEGRVQTDAEQRMRELRKLGFIPTGGRGPNAPEIGPEHCATFVIAVGGATKASEAGRAVLNFAPLVPQAPGKEQADVVRQIPEGEVWGETLREVLVRAFEDFEIGIRIRELRFLHDETSVVMLWRDQNDELRQTSFWREDLPVDQRHWRGVIRDETVISGRLIATILADLEGDVPLSNVLGPDETPTETKGATLGDILGAAIAKGKKPRKASKKK